MNKRDYLRSIGFTVGERGRFTPAMMTALQNFEGGETVKPTITPIIEQPVYHMPEQPKMRESRTLYGYDKEGHKIAFILCFSCKQHMMYCACKNGIVAPSSVVTTKEKDVYVKTR